MELKKTDIYVIFNQVNLAVKRHRIGRGFTENIRFSSKKEAEDYIEKNCEEHLVALRVRFEDEYWQHIANSIEILK
tara:strand:- start:366 stop:593 length:228 start_codon:yes stop_codon:yes gene_type:complete